MNQLFSLDERGGGIRPTPSTNTSWELSEGVCNKGAFVFSRAVVARAVLRGKGAGAAVSNLFSVVYGRSKFGR